jgi:hypothetical protein
MMFARAKAEQSSMGSIKHKAVRFRVSFGITVLGIQAIEQ